MGNRGPIPNADDARRRRNLPVVPTAALDVDKLIADGDPASLRVTGVVEIPQPDPAWHEIVLKFWDSLEKSGQSALYEPSDWMTAYVLCESLSRDLQEQFLGFQGVGVGMTEPLYGHIPLKAAALASYLKGFGALLVTVGDRRRMHIELKRAEVERMAPVLSIVQRREELAGGLCGCAWGSARWCSSISVCSRGPRTTPSSSASRRGKPAPTRCLSSSRSSASVFSLVAMRTT